MRIDRAYLPVETLGPGKRLVVWTQGCSKHCPECSNPELWPPQGGREIANDALATLLCALAKQANITRITFTGGDPLEQPDALLEVLRAIRPQFRDILIYTGHTLEQVKTLLGVARFAEFIGLADVVIDGPYEKEYNDGVCALRGSTNQRVHLFSTDKTLEQDYADALVQPRRVQNVVFDGRSMSIGIHTT